jgi:hypothetical protein
MTARATVKNRATHPQVVDNENTSGPRMSRSLFFSSRSIFPFRLAKRQQKCGLEQKIIRQRNRINYLQALATNAEVAELGLANRHSSQCPA